MTSKEELVQKLNILMPGVEPQIRAVLSAYQIAPASSDRPPDLHVHIESFLAAKCIDGLTPKTLKNYRDFLGMFAAHTNKCTDEITVDDIRVYLCYLSNERGLKQNSVQTHINTLRSFFTWLTAEEIIQKNPMLRIHSLRIDKNASRHALSPDELEQLRNGCKTDKEKALVEFLVSSGCRLSEVAGRKVKTKTKHSCATYRHHGGYGKTVKYKPRDQKSVDDFAFQVSELNEEYAL